MPIDLKKIEKTKEFKALEKTLSSLRKSCTEFIAEAFDENKAKRRAAILNQRLEKTMGLSSNNAAIIEEIEPSLFGDRRCPKGTVFDPVTQTCV
jgi:hypothetical protein